jgi:kynurenine formamidase
VLYDAGTDLGSAYNTDIVGTERPQGDAWDIGAFEFIAAAVGDVKAVGITSISAAPSTAGTLVANKKALLAGVASVASSSSTAGTLVAASYIPQTLTGVASIASAPSSVGTLVSKWKAALLGEASVSTAPSTAGTVKANKKISLAGIESLSTAPSTAGTLVAIAGLIGSAAFGHVTDVEETNTETFADNWTVGDATISGEGDAEKITFTPGQTKESLTWNLGSGLAKVDMDKYGDQGTGGLTVEYKTGTDEEDCDADDWHVYGSEGFQCQGWVKLKVAAPV